MSERSDLEMESAAGLNFVERLGLEFLRGQIEREDSHIHRWSPSELAEIQQIERWTIGIAALSGAVSGGILGAVEIGLRWWLLGESGATDWWQRLPYWSIYLGLTVVVSGTEILYLYWNVLRTVARISSIAGLRLSDEENDQATAIGVVRAALDFPNRRAPIYGIDPYARVSRWKRLAYSVLYRAKIGVTSFVLRVLLRRILARATLRFLIPLVGIPVFALWNGLITRWVMRAVRIRAAGPVAVQETGDRILAEQANLCEKSRRLIVETVGEAIIRSEDAHPNFVLLLARLFQDFDISPDSINIDWDANRARLQNMNRQAQDLLLTVVTIAVVLDGRPRTAQREFLEEVHTLCGRSFQSRALLELYRQFLDGQGLSEKQLMVVRSRSEE